MCGIAGIFDPSGQQQINTDVLTHMNDVQFHRGPDEGGIYVDQGIGLAHRRLSIIDISTGQQPLFSEDKQVAIVFNGEIYNFKSIRQELEQQGYQFATHSDTEVILKAWQAWGPDCVHHLRGMFAFAIWDAQQESLFLARDRVGIKPVFYSFLPDGQFIFGSELKALTAHPDFQKILDPRGVEDYFALGYIAEPKTIYRGTYKLPPGHHLLFKRNQTQPDINEYWDIPFRSAESISEDDAETELVRQIKEAVDVRLVAEVPLGAFLSGGVDSSAVVAMMAQLQDDPVNTCAIGFNEKQFNESEFAKMVADRYETEHFAKVVDTQDFDLIDQLALLYDEPYADSSAMPTYRVCQLAKERVTVALSGDGGDEALAGYRRYRWHMNEERLRNTMPLWFRKPVFGTLGRLYPKLDRAPRFLRAKSTFQSLGMDSVEGYFHSVSINREEHRRALFSPSLKQKLEGYNALDVFRGHAENCGAEDTLSLIQYLDFKTYLPGDILTKVDRASMAHSLEVRVPLLDHKLLEWASGLPANLKLNGQEGKYLLKKSMEPHLPNDVLYRQKMGFAVPLADWFRGPLKDRVRTAVLSDTMAESGFFNMDYIQRVVDDHQSGVRDYSAPLWTLMMFESFMRQCYNADGASHHAPAESSQLSEAV